MSTDPCTTCCQTCCGELSREKYMLRRHDCVTLLRNLHCTCSFGDTRVAASYSGALLARLQGHGIRWLIRSGVARNFWLVGPWGVIKNFCRGTVKNRLKWTNFVNRKYHQFFGCQKTQSIFLFITEFFSNNFGVAIRALMALTK